MLREPFEKCKQTIRRIFPRGISEEDRDESSKLPSDAFDGIPDKSDDDEEAELENELWKSCLLQRPGLQPRLLLTGLPGLGQAQLASSILHLLEGCPLHAIDLLLLYTTWTARTPQSALTAAVREACRAAPAVLYLPHLDLCRNTAHSSLRLAPVLALRDIPADLPVLLLATTEGDVSTLHIELMQLFTGTVILTPSTAEQREEMFASIIEQANSVPRTSTAVLKMKRAETVRPLSGFSKGAPRAVSSGCEAPIDTEEPITLATSNDVEALCYKRSVSRRVGATARQVCENVVRSKKITR